MHPYWRRSGFLLLLSCTLVDAYSATRHKKKMASPQNDADNLNLVLVTDGSYRVNVRQKSWLFGAPTFFNVDGQPYTQNENLKLVANVTANGTDSLGQFKLITFQYQAGKTQLVTSFKTYEGQPLVYFSQAYVNGANKTTAESVDRTISGFPSFTLTEVKTMQGPLGYLAFGGIHCADTGKKFGVFSPEMDITDGLSGGPIAVFDGSGDTLIISPASNFMAASNWHEQEGDKNRLVYGIMGGVDEVPVGTVVEFIVYYSSQGVNKAFEDWGRHLQKVYGRTDAYVLSDITVNYLGYYTDNGAYYYYKTEPDKNYQNTILDAKAYADSTGIPYGYVQFDSWWYYKGAGGGVKTWEARPDIFPDGLQFVYNKTGLHSVGHNRYWSNDTTYARRNGGRYNFVVDAGSFAVPDDQTFWNDLLANASSWGLITYEQDWLNKEFAGAKALVSDVTLGARWLNQMASGAVTNGMTIQYCMANSRHVMQALGNSVVTQVRASNDYKPGEDQWKIGVSSLFAYAMGIAPFKDNFWSTTDQPGNKYKASEPFNELQMTVAVLSTGPVAPSDGIGYSNDTLLMRCCNAEGLILKPSKPATAIDDQIYKEALPSSKIPDGEVWSTYSNVSGFMYGIIFVPELRGQYNITPSKAGFHTYLEDLKVYEAHNVDNMAAFSDEEPLQLAGCNKSQPCLYHTAPVLSANRTLVLLGELDKVVPVSPRRITQIEVLGEEIKVHLRGVPNERVDITFSMESSLMTVTCLVGPSRTVVADLPAQTCQ